LLIDFVTLVLYEVSDESDYSKKEEKNRIQLNIDKRPVLFCQMKREFVGHREVYVFKNDWEKVRIKNRLGLVIREDRCGSSCTIGCFFSTNGAVCTSKGST